MAIAADNTQGMNDFRKELINRFFNPKSYFLFSFITDLKNQEALLENPENVAVVGLVVDEILNARDKIETLFELTKISGFDEFYHLLMEKVGFLRMSHLTTQQMMETVKNLGILLSETFSEMMTHPDSKKQLLQYVGLEVEHPALEKEPIPDVSEEESRAEKPPDQELQTDLSSEAVTHSSNLDDLFRDVQKPSQIVDPWDFFHDDVAQKLDEINALLPEFKANKHNRALLQKIKLAFQELREWSMIQGNEGIETIAMRTLTVLNFILRTSRFPMEKIIPDIEEAVKALQEVNHSGWAGENLDIVPIVVHSLETLSKTVQTIAGEN
ncbi:MAG TPA: hypothetical protein ENH53_07195, partial [Bacteroidetes bacterium]|nr:hypothetical protein [Bacteroidota bacterium]